MRSFSKESPPPWKPRDRRLGEPLYDKFMIGGTVSLGVLMWIGATAVLIVSLVEQSKYLGAQLSDFESLGPQGCRIVESFSYNIYDKRLDALNTNCMEQWTYTVQVVDRGLFFELPAISPIKIRR